MFAQMDETETIDGFRPAELGPRADAVVQGDDVGPRAQPFLGDRFEQGQTHAFLGRRWAGIDVEHDQVLMGLQRLGQIAILGGHEQFAGRKMLENRVPVEIGFGDKQYGVRRQHLGKMARPFARVRSFVEPTP